MKPIARAGTELPKISNEPPASILFVDIAGERGLSHVYDNGMQGVNLMVEATGGGAGWLDFDGDGHWDLYLNQGGEPTQPSDRLADQLFRNTDGERFESVTAAARIHETRYGQGVAIGDFDSDGFDDIYVTNVGRNTLLRNNGDGTFGDVTLAAGVGDERWSTSAAWADLDHDGFVDLYVCNYCDYDPAAPIPCLRDGEPRICHPKDIPPVPDEFFRNRGNGTFTAEAVERGLVGLQNRGLGVVTADFDNDGDSDVYVANDTTANFLFDNDGTGHFIEVGTLRGCAVDRNGATQASMGLACGDFDGDGWLDLYSTHFYRESNTLYRCLGKTGYEDVTAQVGLHLPTLNVLGFGTVMADFDLNGHPELFVTNGHIDPTKTMDAGGYAMQPQLFSFDGHRWHDLSVSAGEHFSREFVGRGVASCDFDADGDTDLCVVHQNASVALLENRSKHGNWLQLRPIGTSGDRRATGCRATLYVGERALMQELCGGTSFASSHQPILTWGLGDWDGPCTLEIRWSKGNVERLDNVTPNQRLTRIEPNGP